LQSKRVIFPNYRSQSPLYLFFCLITWDYANKFPVDPSIEKNSMVSERFCKNNFMLPQVFQPMLATMAEPFDSELYIFEVKWDGYRCLTFFEDGKVRLQSRNAHDFTAVFPDLQALAGHIRRPGCLLDGEIIALRDGKPSFLELQKRAQLRNERLIKAAVAKIPVFYVAFDILYCDNQPVYPECLERRIDLLTETIRPGDLLIQSEIVKKNGLQYFHSVSALGLEGVIAKRKGSPYLPGKRVKYWLKFKRKQVGSFVICGYIPNPAGRDEIRSLILGAYRYERFSFFGMVGTGLSGAELNFFHRELNKIRTYESPFPVRPPVNNACWTRPLVVCDVEYLELTDDGALRHPIFQRLRPDLRAEDCHFGEVSAP
jgi:DNA ligase D-like protein (predicted ligase)